MEYHNTKVDKQKFKGKEQLSLNVIYRFNALLMEITFLVFLGSLTFTYNVNNESS